MHPMLKKRWALYGTVIVLAVIVAMLTTKHDRPGKSSELTPNPRDLGQQRPDMSMGGSQKSSTIDTLRSLPSQQLLDDGFSLGNQLAGRLSPESVVELTRCLRDPHERPEIKRIILRALIQIDDPAVQEAVSSILEVGDQPDYLLEAALYYVVQNAKPPNLELIKTLVQKSSAKSVLIPGLLAIGRLGAEGAIDWLRAFSQERSQSIDLDVRRAIAEASSLTRSDTAIPFIRELVRSHPAPEREALMLFYPSYLANIGSVAAASELRTFIASAEFAGSAMKDALSDACVRALASISGSRAVDELFDLAAGDYPISLRKASVRELGARVSGHELLRYLDLIKRSTFDGSSVEARGIPTSLATLALESLRSNRKIDQSGVSEYLVQFAEMRRSGTRVPDEHFSAKAIELMSEVGRDERDVDEYLKGVAFNSDRYDVYMRATAVRTMYARASQSGQPLRVLPVLRALVFNPGSPQETTIEVLGEMYTSQKSEDVADVLQQVARSHPVESIRRKAQHVLSHSGQER